MFLTSSDLGFVMLIDDSKVDNYINTKVLELSEKAKDIKVFDNANEALEFLNNSVQIPNVIFLDIYMPSMDGFDFLEEFEKLPDHIKNKTKVLLLSSAYDMLEVEKLKRYHWLSGYITKPLTYESLNSRPIQIQ